MINRALVSLMIIILSGCSTMDINEYKDNSPEFVLEDYFSGRTVAHGVFENRSGEVIKQFKVTLNGHVEDNVLILEEDFVYMDGKLDKRLWHINILPDGHYEGTTNGVIGVARGQRAGNAFHWTYVFDLPVKNTSYKLKFDDWMFLQEDGVMINRAHVTKWGFKVGSVTLSFYKEDGLKTSSTSSLKLINAS